MKRQVIQGGIKGLRSFLQAEKRRLAMSPILLMTSGSNTRNDGTAMEESCKHVHFILAQQLALRTVVSSSLQDSAFPTVESVQQQKDLGGRVGTTTICAVGSEAAMHLAKATVAAGANENSRMDELILVPTTFPAVMASTMTGSLLLDTKEETLVPATKSASLFSPDGGTSMTVAQPDASMLDMASTKTAVSTHPATREAAFAALSLCLSRCFQGKAYNEQIVTMLTTFASHLEQDQPKEALQALLETLVLTGQDTSWGYAASASERRDIPLAISVALLPKIFPDSNSLAMWASLAPTLLCHVDASTEAAPLRDAYARLDIVLGSPNVLVSNQSSDTLFQLVRDNQTSWQCLDAPKDVLIKCLGSYSLVD